MPLSPGFQEGSSLRNAGLWPGVHPMQGRGGLRRRRRRGDKGSGRGGWELPPTEASGEVWGLK